eukprot:TRINITY_DN1450_c0_g1_i2.p1 TRINITY_DN1450_c0_g1~~TRINITY_DN1450_c0_g1_i2.p1  ORF type:complete len:217 (-),score=24.08 TRINITY_DN1450_c0_g1_i2:39-689(-)
MCIRDRYLLKSISIALQELAALEIYHEEVIPANIFLNTAGKVRLAHVKVFGTGKTAYIKVFSGQGRIPLSPEQFKLLNGRHPEIPSEIANFKQHVSGDSKPGNNRKQLSDVFCLGMTMLLAASLESPDQLINWTVGQEKVEMVKVQALINQLRERYSEEFCQCLRSMLNEVPIQRIQLREIIERCNKLPPRENKLPGKNVCGNTCLLYTSPSPRDS